MQNETHEVQSEHREHSVAHEQTEAPPKSTRPWTHLWTQLWTRPWIRLSTKTILVAVILCVITLSTLAILYSRAEHARKDATTPGHDVVELDKKAAGAIGADITGLTLDKTTVLDIDADTNDMTLDKVAPRTGGTFDTIARSIESQSTRTRQGFNSLHADHAGMNQALFALSSTMSAMHASVAELHKDREDLNQHIQRIDVAQSQCKAITKDVRKPRIAAKKKIGMPQINAAKNPPFHIDAIDLWDNVVYVVISKDTQITFLREGGQRFGWKVTHIDQAKGQVVFRGPAGQDYSVSLSR